MIWATAALAVAILLSSIICAMAQTPVNPIYGANGIWNGPQSQPWCQLTFANPLISSAVLCANEPRASPQLNAVTLTGNTQLPKSAGLVSGETVIYRFAQDGTGGRTVTIPTDGSVIVSSSSISAGAFVLTGTALSIDEYACIGYGGVAPTWIATLMECRPSGFNLIHP